MQSVTRVLTCVLATAVLGLAGCSEEPRDFIGDKDPTTPMSGKLTLDGQPQIAILVTAVSVGPEKHPPTLVVTDQEGRFAMTTYKNEDGLLYGDYALTFKQTKPALPDPIDMLGGRYSDPETSEHKFTIEEGKPIVIDNIELTSQ